MIFDLHLYSEKSQDPTWNAQQNLDSRTHYVCAETLRYHGSRILETYIVDQGRLFALVESFKHYDGTRRRRFAVFNVAGDVVGERSTDGWKTTDQARTAMWAELDTLDAEALTSEAIDRARRYLDASIEYLEGQLADL
jgi:hypothetical protein